MFFEKKGPHTLKKISNICENSDSKHSESIKIDDIRDLSSASIKDITFFHSSKYKSEAKKTKALACITKKELKKYLPEKCLKILVKNVLLSVAKVGILFYPNSDIDPLDKSLLPSDEVKNKYNNVIFGKNVLVGKNVQIGKNTVIGNNTIVEHDVQIGENCQIGSFVSIKNSILENDVLLQDNVKIGVKGFGFIPNANKNFRAPHIGKVVVKQGSEVGSGSTIDRGSMTDTIIGENTFIDNQVHIAHNVKIGKNCMIAGQVGFAGSSNIGNNVVIGGQAGISGHLNIGNNVSIGGGSGVIKDIPDNTKVMGYPSIEFKEFIKKWKSNE
tara:strand:- start:64 stop:1047 length:984 start_codon:yes stop_codon:yes gene_type:complete